jgi:DMSO/TMAO reductase YedYZ molybdopterin-dependent catalytic subunit
VTPPEARGPAVEEPATGRLRLSAAQLAGRIATARDDAMHRPAHDDRTAAVLGIALGVSFSVCFLTGLYSHLLQQPPTWIAVPPAPAGLYRITQGLHVASGIASIPLLLAKLWSVYPRLFAWPPFRGIAHAVERAALVVLVAGSLFMLFTGTANVARWYPWTFFFPAGHYWAAWITIGALVVHVGAKLSVVRRVLGRPVDATSVDPGAGLTRRGFLGAVVAAAGLLTLTTVGQTVAPLRRFTLFAPRRPDIGPQGLPVNQSAAEAGVVDAAQSTGYRLVVTGAVAEELSLTREDLAAMGQRHAVLPIACVEGWSASARWGGVRVGALLDAAGVEPDREVEIDVESLERDGLYGRSILTNNQARADDTLLALTIDGEDLDVDHGYPCRLIAGNRPGVLQTKWVERLVVRS